MLKEVPFWPLRRPEHLWSCRQQSHRREKISRTDVDCNLKSWSLIFKTAVDAHPKFTDRCGLHQLARICLSPNQRPGMPERWPADNVLHFTSSPEGMSSTNVLRVSILHGLHKDFRVYVCEQVSTLVQEMTRELFIT